MRAVKEPKISWTMRDFSGRKLFKNGNFFASFSQDASAAECHEVVEKLRIFDQLCQRIYDSSDLMYKLSTMSFIEKMDQSHAEELAQSILKSNKLLSEARRIANVQVTKEAHGKRKGHAPIIGRTPVRDTEGEVR